MDLDEIIGILKQATEKYNFLYIEDPVDENDWEGWVKAAKALDRTTLCGDDLTVTNIDYLRKALDMGACGAFVFKPNQVGTVTEARKPSGMPWSTECSPFPPSGRRRQRRPCGGHGHRRRSGGGEAGPAQIRSRHSTFVNSLLRAETELPAAKPFDFSPFVKF